MDPLSVKASMVGIDAAANHIFWLLSSIITNTKNAPQVAAALYCVTNDIRTACWSLQVLLADLSSVAPHRAALIQLDQLIVTLTECVLTFSELDTIITPLAVCNKNGFPSRTRVKWTRIESGCSKIVEKLQRQSSSISLMLNILHCVSDAEASRSQKSLERLVEQVLQSNQEVCKRLNDLEDLFGAGSINTKSCSSPSIMSWQDNAPIVLVPRPRNEGSYVVKAVRLRFNYEEDLECCRVYRMARNDCCDHSFPSSAISTEAWSIFRGISLADISTISVVALPMHSNDIVNRVHYAFGDIEALKQSDTGTLRTNSQEVLEPEPLRLKYVMNTATSIGLAENARDVEGENPTMERIPQVTSRLVSNGSLDVKEAVPSSQVETYSALSSCKLSDLPISTFAGIRMDPTLNKKLWTDDFVNAELDDTKTAHSINIQERVDYANKVDNCGLIDVDDIKNHCVHCRRFIEKGRAFELGGNWRGKWHIDCLHCNICGVLLHMDGNLLHLDNGSLICSRCAFCCNRCGRLVEDIPFLIEDTVYCANCLKCWESRIRSPSLYMRYMISNMRFTRWSQADFYLFCHDLLMTRRCKGLRKRQDSPVRNTMLSVNKPLPAPPIPPPPRFVSEESLKEIARNSCWLEKKSTKVS